ncbi:hypothetical protein ACE3NQ_16450 [Paenibacillus terreus]|uniref:Uncharacterized protein n=1 Tax=Paenibacillus terreus TaxID=1387834 RepID=A0ABV5BB06_9BACL
MHLAFKTLYDLEHGHILFPSELIENAKLSNYEYVNFHKSLDGLNVECLCHLDDGSKVLFTYYFDFEDKLMRLISDDGVYTEVLFDRKLEIQKLREKLTINSTRNLINN